MPPGCLLSEQKVSDSPNLDGPGTEVLFAMSLMPVCQKCPPLCCIGNYRSMQTEVVYFSSLHTGTGGTDVVYKRKYQARTQQLLIQYIIIFKDLVMNCTFCQAHDTLDAVASRWPIEGGLKAFFQQSSHNWWQLQSMPDLCFYSVHHSEVCRSLASWTVKETLLVWTMGLSWN